MRRVVAISDMHGHLGTGLPDGDVLVILGDTAPLYSSAEHQLPKKELDWFRRKFSRWIVREMRGFKQVIYTGSNHDCLFEHEDTAVEARQMLVDLGVTPTWTVRDTGDGIVIAPDPIHAAADLTFAAYNLSPTIHQRPWPFSVARGSQRMYAELAGVIEAARGHQVDVLLSHSPPAGFVDLNDEGQHCGCGGVLGLLGALQPSLSLHGHIHEERGRRVRIMRSNGKKCVVANVSLVDRAYSPRGGRAQSFDVQPKRISC